jgi:hypothetical protein
LQICIAFATHGRHQRLNEWIEFRRQRAETDSGARGGGEYGAVKLRFGIS